MAPERCLISRRYVLGKRPNVDLVNSEFVGYLEPGLTEATRKPSLLPGVAIDWAWNCWASVVVLSREEGKALRRRLFLTWRDFRQIAPECGDKGASLDELNEWFKLQRSTNGERQMSRSLEEAIDLPFDGDVAIMKSAFLRIWI